MKKTLKKINEQSSKAILSSKQLNSLKGGTGNEAAIEEIEFVHEYVVVSL